MAKGFHLFASKLLLLVYLFGFVEITAKQKLGAFVKEEEIDYLWRITRKAVKEKLFDVPERHKLIDKTIHQKKNYVEGHN